MSDKVFVYGTLRQGFNNYNLIEKHVKSVTMATLPGIMYDLGDYPAIVPGEGIIVGEVMEFHDPDHALHVMDLLEEYNGPGHPDNEYERVLLEVETQQGEKVRCQVYIYSDIDTDELDQFERIEEGDWSARSHSKERL